MSRKKQTNFLIGSVIFLVSALVIFLSGGNTSKLASTFQELVASPTPKITVEENIKGESTSVNFSPVPSEVVLDSTIENNDNADTTKIIYRVVKVVDGDTVDVDIDGKVERLRLIGIDTPETVDPRKAVQCFGKEASNKAKELLNGQSVSLESDGTQGERDKYKRLLRYVFLPDGTNFNLYMISEGYAHEYTYDKPYKYQADFKQAEIDARNGNRGLWNPDTCNGNK